MDKPIIVICGPTASGKSHIALSIAQERHSVIINADSMQVYREIPVLSAQPTLDEQQDVPHKLYGVFPASEPCSVVRWIDMAKKAIDETHSLGRIPILVGGTGLYLKSLMYGIAEIPDIPSEVRSNTQDLLKEVGNDMFHAMLAEKDPVMAVKIQPGDSQRMLRAYEVVEHTGTSLNIWQNMPTNALYPEESFLALFINPEREILYESCDSRFLMMIENGAIDEVMELDQQGYDTDLPAMKALGVPQLLEYIHGDTVLHTAISQAQKATRNYAKRQVTWFRHQLPNVVEVSYDEIKDSIEFVKGKMDAFLGDREELIQ